MVKMDQTIYSINNVIIMNKKLKEKIRLSLHRKINDAVSKKNWEEYQFYTKLLFSIKKVITCEEAV